MKKLALYLVLLLGLGFYAACDGGGDDDDGPSCEFNEITSTVIPVGGTEYKKIVTENLSSGSMIYYSFTPEIGGDYKITVSDIDSDVSWRLYTGTATCVDDRDLKDIFSANDYTDNTDETGNATGLATSTNYVLKVRAYDPLTGYTLTITKL